jgi:hypothetical protein
MHIYKGGLIPVNAHNGFHLAHLLRQTTPAHVATVVVNVKRSFADRHT